MLNMKKTLLTVIAVGLSALPSLADVHTIVFDSKEDVYGLKLQTFQNERAMNAAVTAETMEFVPGLTFTEDGIDFSIKKTGDTGLGYALVDAGGANYGLCVYSYLKAETHMKTELSLTVPNGKIKGVKLYMSGYAVYNLEIPFNGTPVEPMDDNALYYWQWTDAEGAETVTCDWSTQFGSRYIHSIEVDYTADLGGKQECGLAFNETATEVVMGEEYTLPVLANPNNLPVSWSSSDENVATVAADGAVTLVGGGKTIISVETAGNESFAKGNARYELTVVPCADNIAELIEKAPNRFDKVKVNFPATVTFANGSYACVIDAENNAGYIHNSAQAGNTSTSVVTIYKVGEVIPGGWIATNDTQYDEETWLGVPPAVETTVEVVFPEVEAVTPADAFRVVILKDVTFTGRTASGNTKAYGTTPDGTKYEFQDTYDTGQKPAGTYDVKVVVRSSKFGDTQYFYLAPLAYTAVDKTGIAEIEAEGADARYFNLQGVEVAQPEKGVYIVRRGDKATKEIVK